MLAISASRILAKTNQDPAPQLESAVESAEFRMPSWVFRSKFKQKACSYKDDEFFTIMESRKSWKTNDELPKELDSEFSI